MGGQKIVDIIKELKVIPVAAVESADDGLSLCETLMKAGLPAIEVTFRTSAAAEIIRRAVKAFPDMLVGAGTVLNTLDLEAAVSAGAKFAVAPGCNPNIISAASDLKLPFFPGISNPSDIELALSLGVKTMKFFPAEACGGVKMLKAIAAPYAHLGVKYIPTGGITAQNMSEYLDFSDVLAVGGTWIVPSAAVKNHQWSLIEGAAFDAKFMLRSRGGK
jgi:2-dehydro-3-deoxyphosphogluconate aldolase/(4S)-4-hydroxy-2-oxoglutarate aldolase